MEDWELPFIPQKSFYEEVFGGELDVGKEQNTSFQSESPRGTKRTMERGVSLIWKMKSILKKMEDFCGTKRNNYKLITTELDDTFEFIHEIRRNVGLIEGCFNSFE